MWFPFRRILTQTNNHRDEVISMAGVVTSLKRENELLKKRCDDYWSQLCKLRQSISEGANDSELNISPIIVNRYLNNLLIKYSIVEDDTYCRIISEQDIFTISFRREFDTTIGNHNWVNIGQALITMTLDNIGRGLSQPTIINSPASGIFECDRNKLIKKGQEICRILKYDDSQKKIVIEEREREHIKQCVLNRERKKMIERETMDELIAEGIIFNVVTNDKGNRMAIPTAIANAVWNRDGGRCCICGSKSELEFDHIIPFSKGGATTFRNLQILCHTCNLKKSNNI